MVARFVGRVVFMFCGIMLVFLGESSAQINLDISKAEIEILNSNTLKVKHVTSPDVPGITVSVDFQWDPANLVFAPVAADIEPPPKNVIRTLQKGDTWNYTVSGTWSNGKTSYNMSGTAMYQILYSEKQSPVTSINCLDEYQVMNITTPVGPLVFAAHSYFTQDGDGSPYSHGGDFGLGSGDIWVISPSWGYFLLYQSPVNPGQNYGTSVTYSDGTSRTYSSSVIMMENVSTGIGTFEAYRIAGASTINFADGRSTVMSQTIWFVPRLGVVREISDATSYVNGKFQLNQKLTMTLSNTSVPH